MSDQDWGGREHRMVRERDWDWDRDRDRERDRDHGHRRLPQTPRKPSTLACQLVPGPGKMKPVVTNQLNVANVTKMGIIGQQKSPSMLNPAGTPQSHLSFGVTSNVTVASDRNDRDHFTRSGLNPNYAGYNGTAKQNGTYSSHPNLMQAERAASQDFHQTWPLGNPSKQPCQPWQRPTTQTNPHNHRKLPALPKQPSSIKLQTWRQSSLPERRNPPGYEFEVPVLAPSEMHPVNDTGDRHRRIKPPTPTKPSTLSFRQSSTMNGSSGYPLFSTQPYQMPKVNASPSTGLNGHVRQTDTMVHFTGGGSSHHRTHLPPILTSDRRTLNLGRSLPLAPAPPPPPAPADHKASNGTFVNGGLSGLFRGTSQEVDWI